MATGKLSPRQRMINMMYLVLIALLALNVSKEVLDAFVIINHGLVKTTSNFAKKNEKIYANFIRAEAENPVKAGPWKRKAYTVKTQAEAIYQYIEDIKINIIISIDGLEPSDREEAERRMSVKEGVENKSDLEIVANLMMNQMKGAKLKREMESFKNTLVDYVKPKDEGFKMAILNSLDTSDPPMDAEGVQHSWESEHFEHLPAIAVICNLTQMQSAVRNAEAEIIAYLELEIDAGSIPFNKVQAIVIPEKTYVTKGDTFKADVFLAASDSLTAPVILIGDVDTVGSGDYEMAGEFDSLFIESGRGKMIAAATTVGIIEWEGIVMQKTTQGTKEYAFKSVYQVAEPSINVSPDKMNVFYIGPDNPVTVSISGFPPDQVKPSISGGGGSIRKGRKPGEYTVVVRTAGKCFVSVSAEMVAGSGKFKNMGKKPFRVKRVPPPIASFMGIEGEGKITTGKLKVAKGVLAKMKNFDFQLPFKVISFDMSISVGGLFVTEKSNSNRLTTNMKKYLKKAKRGQRIILENVRAKSPKTKAEKITGVTLKVV
ncbi:MAG TPA: gliding motility protein GldM [Flavobacteriales bacterium]|nr:gliding motility protein GldM [Flavobacteriales bacterium]